MITTNSVALVCTGCGAATRDRPSAREAVTEALGLGWQFDQGARWCAQCSGAPYALTPPVGEPEWSEGERVG